MDSAGRTLRSIIDRLLPPEMAAVEPKWTVWGQRREGKYIGFCRFTFDDEADAKSKHDELESQQWVVTMRPWERAVDLHQMHILDAGEIR